MQATDPSAAALLNEKQYFSELARIDRGLPGDNASKVVAVFGLADPNAKGGLFNDQGGFEAWDRPVVAYAPEFLQTLQAQGRGINGDSAIVNRLSAEMPPVQNDTAQRERLPSAVDVAIDHKIQMEQALAQGAAGFGRKAPPMPHAQRPGRAAPAQPAPQSHARVGRG